MFHCTVQLPFFIYFFISSTVSLFVYSFLFSFYPLFYSRFRSISDTKKYLLLNFKIDLFCSIVMEDNSKVHRCRGESDTFSDYFYVLVYRAFRTFIFQIYYDMCNIQVLLLIIIYFCINM